MSGLDLRALREAAEGATPGPWHVCDSQEWHENTDQVICADEHVPVASLADEWYEVEDGEPASADDARWIAAANPSVVLALLDRVEAAEGAVERVRAVLRDYELGARGSLSSIMAIEAALDGPR